MHERLHYRSLRTAQAVFPGAHVGQMAAAGQLFKRHAPLLSNPDPRRIDLRASLLDPSNSYRVRLYQQPSKITVTLIADLSASMRFSAAFNKQQTLANLMLALAEAAQGYGDHFSFLGLGDRINARWLSSSSQGMGQMQRMAQQLVRTKLHGGVKAFTEIKALVPKQHSLIFLASDFHWPLAHCQQVLSQLQGQAIIPVVFWDAQAIDTWPDWRLVNLRDLESGKCRTLFMHPSLRRNIQQAYATRKQALSQCFRTYGLEPLFLSTEHFASPFNQYFAQHHAAQGVAA